MPVLVLATPYPSLRVLANNIVVDVVGILFGTLVRHLSPASDCANRLRVEVFSIRDKDLVIRLLE